MAAQPDEKKRKLPRGVYEKRGELWVFVGRRGQKFHRPAHTTSVKTALEVRDALLKEVLAGEKTVAGVGNVLCGQLLDNYLDRLKRTSKADSDTYPITKNSIEKHVRPFFGKRKAETLPRTKLEGFRDQKLEEVGQVSINRLLGYLRTAYRRGKDDKLVNHIPDFSTTILKSAEHENVRTGIITETQYEKLVPALVFDPLTQILFVMVWNTGVRPAEGFRLEWTQLDRENRLLKVYKRQAKIGKFRFLPLRKEVFEHLLAWEAYLLQHVRHPKHIFTHPGRGDRMKKSDYRGPWEKACLACGYAEELERDGRKYIKTNVLFYDARRSFRTYLPSEINTEDGKSVMGHEEDSTFGRYLNSQKAAERVLTAMEKTPAPPPPTETPKMSVVERIAALKDLTALLQAGTITDEEFAEMKAGL